MKMIYRSKKDRKKIDKLINKYRKKLGLTEWEIYWIEAGPYSSTVTEECNATIHRNMSGRIATIYVSPFCYELKSTIKHEMMHILLADLAHFAYEGSDKAKEDEIFAAEHKIINRLKNIL